MKAPPAVSVSDHEEIGGCWPPRVTTSLQQRPVGGELKRSPARRLVPAWPLQQAATGALPDALAKNVPFLRLGGHPAPTRLPPVPPAGRLVPAVRAG